MEKIFRTIKEKLKPSLLHSLTLHLLDAKKQNNLRRLQSIHQMIFEKDIPEVQEGQKLFMELVMVTHPDRLTFISAESEKAFYAGDRKTLEFYHRLLKTAENIKTEPAPPEKERFEWDEEEAYSYGTEDFDQNFSHSEWDFEEEMVREEESGYNFIRAVKAEYLGSLDFTFNAADLASISGEMDLSDYDIADLDGIEYCLGLTVLNLSHNRISNLHDLAGLHNLKELYLGENLINDISALSELSHLEILDISDNDIEDLGPLLHLADLKFVNLSGNSVETGAAEVLKALRKRGIMLL